MAVSSEISPQPLVAHSATDGSAVSSKMPLFSKDSKSISPKKGKGTQANGVEQTPNNANAAGGSVQAAGAGDTGAGVRLDAPKVAPSASTLQPSSSTREGDSSGSQSVEQGTTSTGERDVKEKASLTGTATTSRHHKDKTSETAHSTILSEKSDSRLRPTKEKAAKKGKKPKSKSIWSKLASAVFKCTWSSDSAHPVDINEGATGVSDPSPREAEAKEGSAVITEKSREITQAQPAVKSVAEPQPSSQTQPPTIEIPSIPTTTISPPAADTATPTSEDADVIVPPSPTNQVLPGDETAGLTSGAVVPPGSTGPQDDDSDESSMLNVGAEEDEDLEERLIMNGGVGIPIGPDGVPRPLLPPIAPQHAGRKCLVLDMDETLLHSSFKSIQHADYVIPVEIEYHWHNVYVIKRPGVDNFLKKMGEIFEVVVFTASLSKYADPVLDKLDVHGVVTHRLFRESCYNHRGSYVKDLSQLGRPMEDTIILDNSPASYIFHPNNAVPVSSWFNDPHDTELTDLCPFLTDLGTVDDVRGVLDGGL